MTEPQDAESNSADPFVQHVRAAVKALTHGVAAIYGYDVAGDIAEFGTMSGQTAAGLAQAMHACDGSLAYSAQMHKHAIALCILNLRHVALLRFLRSFPLLYRMFAH